MKSIEKERNDFGQGGYLPAFFSLIKPHFKLFSKNIDFFYITPCLRNNCFLSLFCSDKEKATRAVAEKPGRE